MMATVEDYSLIFRLLASFSVTWCTLSPAFWYIMHQKCWWVDMWQIKIRTIWYVALTLSSLNLHSLGSRFIISISNGYGVNSTHTIFHPWDTNTIRSNDAVQWIGDKFNQQLLLLRMTVWPLDPESYQLGGGIHIHCERSSCLPIWKHHSVVFMPH